MNLKTIYKHLSETYCLDTSEINSNDNHQISIFLQDYIKTDKKNFNLMWFDEFSQETHSINFDIGDILDRNGKSRLLSFSHNFIHNPNQNDFNGILKSLFLIQLSVLVSYATKRELHLDENDIALVTMIVLTFFPSMNKNLPFTAFDYYIREDDIKKISKMNAKNTLFPLTYKIFNYLNNDVGYDEKKFHSLQLSPLYQKLLDNLYSKNEEEFKEIIDKLCEYHLEKSCSYSNYEPYPEFEYAIFQAIPCEILSLLKLRYDRKLEIDFIKHPLVKSFIPFIKSYDKEYVDDEINLLKNKIFNEYEFK